MVNRNSCLPAPQRGSVEESDYLTYCGILPSPAIQGCGRERRHGAVGGRLGVKLAVMDAHKAVVRGGEGGGEGAGGS